MPPSKPCRYRGPQQVKCRLVFSLNTTYQERFTSVSTIERKQLDTGKCMVGFTKGIFVMLYILGEIQYASIFVVNYCHYGKERGQGECQISFCSQS